jgi:hypothetical protein
MPKEIDTENELEKNYETFYDWLEKCPFEWKETSHPSSGMTTVNFTLIKE